MGKKPKEITINPEHTLEDLTSISQTVMPLAKKILGAGGLMEMDLLGDWQNIVGEDLSQYSLPQRLNFRRDERTNGCLELLVLGGAFALEIKQREAQILEKINTYFGYTAVDRLKIIQCSNPDNFLLKKPQDNPKKNLVSLADKCYVTELVKDIDNQKLRETLENIGLAVFGSKQE